MGRSTIAPARRRVKKRLSTFAMPQTKVRTAPRKALTVVKSIFTKTKEPFPFMTLPAELRLIIYKFVLEDEERRFWFLERKCEARVPAILQVHPKVTLEASEFYWPTGQFELVVKLKHIHLFHRFIQRSRPEFLKLLCSNPSILWRMAIRKDCEGFKEWRRLRLLGDHIRRAWGHTSTSRQWCVCAENPKATKLVHHDLSRLVWQDDGIEESENVGQVFQGRGIPEVRLYLHLLEMTRIIYPILRDRAGKEVLQ